MRKNCKIGCHPMIKQWSGESNRGTHPSRIRFIQAHLVIDMFNPIPYISGSLSNSCFQYHLQFIFSFIFSFIPSSIFNFISSSIFNLISSSTSAPFQFHLHFHSVPIQFYFSSISACLSSIISSPVTSAYPPFPNSSYPSIY